MFLVLLPSIFSLLSIVLVLLSIIVSFALDHFSFAFEFLSDDDGFKNHIFLVIHVLNSLFHYAHRVGHLIFIRFPPLDAQNDLAGSRLWGFVYLQKLGTRFFVVQHQCDDDDEIGILL